MIQFEVGWQTDEELLLLESIELYGFGNWHDISTYVGTKSAKKCELHYERVYMQTQCTPLPDMAQTQLLPPPNLVDDDNDDTINDTASSSNNKSNHRSKTKLKSNQNKSKASKNTLNHVHQLQRHNSNSSVSTAMTQLTGDPQRHKWLPSILRPKTGIASIIGFVPNRLDYDNEYNNDAELYICELEFHNTDSELDIQYKLALIDIYNNVLDARIERKQLIMKHELFDKFDKPIKRSSAHEQQIYEQFKLYLRFMSTQHHESLIQLLSREQQLIHEIKQYQQYRVHGIKYICDIPYYQLQQQHKQKLLQSNGYQQSIYNNDNTNGMLSFHNEQYQNDESESQLNRSDSIDTSELDKHRPSFDLNVMPGNELLSTTEYELCNELHLIPKHYFLLKHTIIRLYLSKSMISFKLLRQAIPRVDSKLLNRLLDYMCSQGWVHTTEQTAAMALNNQSIINQSLQQYQNNNIQHDSKNVNIIHNSSIVNQQPFVATVLQL